ncbi:putative F-box protein At3g24700 [Rutidosis leptorrhynchoides]|uniref:putative F-box protein At3g24700 n=1 Tax=Rutidosis leptorrhynchoides TaxID=125765 RepID=UPI003A991C2E
MKTYRRRKRTTLSEFPDEILSEILSWLPAKTLLRLKSVSKQWHSLLTTQLFKNTHLNHITKHDHQNPNKILQLSEDGFQTIDCQSPEHGVGVTHNRPLPLTLQPTKVVILASCHGLVCVGVLNYGNSYYFCDLILWNPLTGEIKTLPKTNYNEECYANCRPRFGLYYSSFDNDYKLICVTADDHNVYGYSLKNDSWRKMVDSTNCLNKIPNLKSECWRLCTWLEENLFFLKQGVKGGDDPGQWAYSIIRFDTKSEWFTEIQIPCIESESGTSYLLTVQRGKLLFYVKYCIGSIQTYIKGWSLNEDGNNWTCLETYKLKSGFISGSRPLHLMRNKDWVMMHVSLTKCRVYRVEIDEKTNRRGDGTCSYKDVISDTGVAEEVRYIETLVSPNQYMNDQLDCSFRLE